MVSLLRIPKDCQFGDVSLLLLNPHSASIVADVLVLLMPWRKVGSVGARWAGKWEGVYEHADV